MKHKVYVARRRCREPNTIQGRVNIPYGTELEAVGRFLIYHGQTLCSVTSQLAYDYFSQNDDGRGLERGALVAEILELLGQPKKISLEERQKRWDRIWAAEDLHKYRRKDHEDFWVWNFDFYNAPVEDLLRIRNLAKEA